MNGLIHVFIVWVCVSSLPASGQLDAGTTTETNGMSEVVRGIYVKRTWGAATNGIKIGARMCALGPLRADRCKVITSIYYSGPSEKRVVLKPPHGSLLEISLTRADGREVRRTKEGDALCKRPPSKLRWQSSRLYLPRRVPSNLDRPFDLRECFDLKEPGEYVLKIKAGLYLPQAYPDYSTLDVPEVRLSLKITFTDLEP
jgi:hypothetical protein